MRKEELDYYAILQVDPRAEKEVIEAAYRRLAAKYHPDVNPSPEAANKMKLMNAAYEVLSNPEKRKAYNLYRGAFPGRRSVLPRLGSWGRRQPLWLLVGALIVMATATRLSPRFLLVLGPLFFLLWAIWIWRTWKD